VARIGAEHEVAVAVENMYPWRARQREFEAYAPSWDTCGTGQEVYPDVTLDVSHAAVAGQDCLELAERLGPRLRHLHLTDGTGLAKDEHLLPGEGSQPVAELLSRLAEQHWDGTVVVEVSTRRSRSPGERESGLAASLAFAREHLRARVP
jgi:sugar phosphate isomerase/epimerase